MERSATKHLWAVAAAAVLSMGCIFGDPEPLRYSGDYRPSRRSPIAGDDGPVPRPFVPNGLTQITTTRPAIRRVAIAELGEPSVPESVVKSLRGTRKSPREVIVLPGVAFAEPKPGVGDRVLNATVHGFSAAILSAATQPSSTQSPTQPVSRPATTIQVDAARIAAEYEVELSQQLVLQSSAEIERLRRQAKAQGADVLLLVTTYEHVGGSKSTVFSLLNLLILPAFILPTEYFNGEVSANGWLIDPADGQVIRTTHWEDRNKRLSQWMFTDGNRDRLWDDQRKDGILEVAKKLLDE